MVEAVRAHSTNRRGMLAGSAGALLGFIPRPPAPPTRASGDDTDLLARCAAFHAREAAVQSIIDRSRAAPPDIVSQQPFEAALDAVSDGWIEMGCAIAALPAITRAGLAAKAGVLDRMLRLVAGDYDGTLRAWDPHVILAASIADDILNRRVP